MSPSVTIRTVKSLPNTRVTALAAIVTIAASAFAVGAAITSDSDSRPDEPTSDPVLSTASSVAPSPGASDIAITISKFAFDPPEISGVIGDTVTWINEDDVTHNVFTSDQLLASADLERGDTYSVTLEEASVIDYYCDIHQYMRGTITVAP